MSHSSRSRSILAARSVYISSVSIDDPVRLDLQKSIDACCLDRSNRCDRASRFSACLSCFPDRLAHIVQFSQSNHLLFVLWIDLFMLCTIDHATLDDGSLKDVDTPDNFSLDPSSRLAFQRAQLSSSARVNLDLSSMTYSSVWYDWFQWNFLTRHMMLIKLTLRSKATLVHDLQQLHSVCSLHWKFQETIDLMAQHCV
jgi:hypothetical protein